MISKIINWINTGTYGASSLLILVSEGVLICLGVAIGVEPPPISCLLEAKNNKIN